MATTSLTPAMHEKAEQIASMVSSFHRGTDRQTGIRFYLVPSSDDPMQRAHRATSLWCSCPGFSKRAVCTHQAGILRAERRAEADRIAAAQQCRATGCTEMAVTRNRRCNRHFIALMKDLSI